MTRWTGGRGEAGWEAGWPAGWPGAGRIATLMMIWLHLLVRLSAWPALASPGQGKFISWCTRVLPAAPPHGQLARAWPYARISGVI